MEGDSLGSRYSGRDDPSDVDRAGRVIIFPVSPGEATVLRFVRALTIVWVCGWIALVVASLAGCATHADVAGIEAQLAELRQVTNQTGEGNVSGGLVALGSAGAGGAGALLMFALVLRTIRQWWRNGGK